MENEKINIYVNKDKETTAAVINDCDFDAVNRIMKRLGADLEDVLCDKQNILHVKDAIMPCKIRGKVKRNSEDEYDEAIGRQEAIKKAIKKHNERFLRALCKWQAQMLKEIRDVSPETFEKALDTLK